MPPSPRQLPYEGFSKEGLNDLLAHNEKTAFPQQHFTYASPPPEGRFHYPDQRHLLQYHQQFSAVANQEHELQKYSTPPAEEPLMEETLRTRSGLAIRRASQTFKTKPEPRSVKQPSKTKRTKKDRMKGDKVAKLDKPLSQLTQNWRSDVIDIEAYVNRSAEKRHAEIHEGKNPGKIKRPMNSFMLYRKAYQHRTKDWCLQNNHQVVSQVCGDSWPLEPKEVKEQFNEWARIERINHQKAHPNYKFTPSKPGTGKAASKRKPGYPESDASDLEDLDWQGRTRRSKKPRQPTQPAAIAPQTSRPVPYPTTRTRYPYESREISVEPGHVTYHPSSFQISNGGRFTSPYDADSLEQGRYYQPYVRGHSPISGVEDVLYRKTSRPQPYPAQQYNDVHVQQEYSYPAQIDPSLLLQGCQQHSEYSMPQMDPSFFALPHPDDQQWAQFGLLDQDFGRPYSALDPALDGTPIHNPHVDILKGNQDGWQVDTLDPNDDFDKWMDEA